MEFITKLSTFIVKSGEKAGSEVFDLSFAEGEAFLEANNFLFELLLRGVSGGCGRDARGGGGGS